MKPIALTKPFALAVAVFSLFLGGRATSQESDSSNWIELKTDLPTKKWIYIQAAA